MEKEYPQEFSPFAWGIAAFCLPVFLWPLALVVSPVLLENPNLADGTGLLMAYVFWLYPVALAIISRIAFKYHKTRRTSAKRLLIISAVIFYTVIGYIIRTGFS